MFIDDEGIDKLYYEPEKYNVEEVFESTMIEYGYLIVDGKAIVPKRNEDEYSSHKSDNINNESDFPF